MILKNKKQGKIMQQEKYKIKYKITIFILYIYIFHYYMITDGISYPYMRYPIIIM